MYSTEVRPATPAEAPAISRLLAEAIRDTYTDVLSAAGVSHLVSSNCSLPRIRAEIGIPGGAPGWLGWLVAADGGEVIGATAGGVPSAGEGELYALCVALDRRGEGVGAALLDAVTALERAQDAKRQTVTLHTAQDPTAGFFRHHGFEGADTRLTRAL